MGNQPSKDTYNVNSSSSSSSSNQRRARPPNTAVYYQKYTQNNTVESSKIVVSPVKHRLVLTEQKSPLVSLTSIGTNSSSKHPEDQRQKSHPPHYYNQHPHLFNKRDSNKSTASSQNSASTAKKKKPSKPIVHKQYNDWNTDEEGNFVNELVIDVYQQPSSKRKNKHLEKDPQSSSNICISNGSDVGSHDNMSLGHDRRDFWVYEYGAEKERDRQTRQHYVLKQVFGGNIHVDLNRPERILESACGVGLWSVEMAQAYPHCQVIGIDVVPPTEKGGWQLPSLVISASSSSPHIDASYSVGQKTTTNTTSSDSAPSSTPTRTNINITFKHCDLLQPTLPFPNDYFDFVYQRDVATVVPFDQWPQIIAEFYRMLKPGGQIQLVEYDLLFRNPGPILTQVNEWYQKMAVSIGVNPEYSEHLTSHLEVVGFTDVETKVFDIPIGEWPSTFLEKQYGYLYKEQMKALFKSMKKWWCNKIEVSPEEYDRVCIEALEEFEQYHGEARWKIFTARKPLEKNGAAYHLG